MLDIIQYLDNCIILFINKYISNLTFVNFFFKYITILGNFGFIWIAIAIILIFYKKTRKISLFILLALLFGSVLGNVILKSIFMRSRPFVQNDFINLYINKPKGYSFPSGHTLSSFIASTLLYNYNKHYGRYFLLLAFLIGISRVILMVHYPSDVLAGAILGFIIGIIFFKFYKYSISRY